MMKQLIINADDCGISTEVNEAIGKCFAEDKITGTSIISVGRYYTQAVMMLRDIGKTEVGVHLALTGDFLPADGDGKKRTSMAVGEEIFPRDYKGLAFHYMCGRVHKKHVYDEFKAQIRKVADSELRVTHIDSHEHIHMLPGILDVTLELAQEFDIPYIRVPVEPAGIITASFKAKDLARYIALRAMSAMNVKKLKNTSIKSNNVFLGHFHSGRITDDILCFMINNLAEGVTEIAVHPAIFAKEAVVGYPARQNAAMEFDVLMNGQWKVYAQKAGASLVSHKDVS